MDWWEQPDWRIAAIIEIDDLFEWTFELVKKYVASVTKIFCEIFIVLQFLKSKSHS